MYCKYCGKEIANDSSYCKYCGGKLFDEELDNDELKTKTNDVQNTTKGIQHSQVEFTHKENNNDSAIANEITANLKMVGWAAAFVAVYLLGFVLVHLKDIKEYDYEKKISFYGESCYDPPSITGNWRLHWEEHYYDLLYIGLYKTIPVKGFETPSPKEYLERAKTLEKEYEKKKKRIDAQLKRQPKIKGVYTWLELEKDMYDEYNNPRKIKEKAKADAATDIESWNFEINHYRKSGFKEDLKKNALYVSLISLSIFILGRYLVKLTKWTKANKTQ